MLCSAVYSKFRPGTPSVVTSGPAVGAGTLTKPVATPVAMKNALSRPIEAAITAAAKGDLTTYLDQFTDPLRGQLERTQTEKGSEYLRDYLKRLTRPVKGVAINLRKKQDTAPDEARLDVEFIYANRNETQPFFLRREDGRWRISSMDSVRSTPVLIPYGAELPPL